jgi:hypothetical protein
MNRELNTLFWYTRSELVLIRRRNKSFISDQSDKKIVTDEEDDCRRDEVDVIMRGIIETLDEILASEAKLWNTPFLVHIIQTFSVHISNLKNVYDTNSSVLYTLIPIDIDYTRVCCYLKIIIAVCEANLIHLCTHRRGNEEGSGGGSFKGSGGGSDHDAFSKTSSNDSSNSTKRTESRVIPCLTRTNSYKKNTIRDDINKSTPSSPNKDRLVNFPPPLRKSLSYTHGTRTAPVEGPVVHSERKEVITDKLYVDKTPSHQVMRWRTAQQAIRWVVRTPEQIVSRLHDTQIGRSKLL